MGEARRPTRRIALALGVVGLVACYVNRVSDENRVLDYASRQMDCDPSLIQLETVSSGDDKVATYVATGCGQRRTVDCTQEGENVVCRQSATGTARQSDSQRSTGGDVLAGVIIGSACACAHAVGRGGSSSSSSPASTTNNNPSDSVRSK